jgi:hypothetical protein
MNAFLISLPVFLLVALGFVLKRCAFFSDAFVGGANAFVYRVSLPALIIHSMAGGLPELRESKWIVLVFSAATIVVQLLAWIYSRWAGHDGAQSATFIQASYRGNLAFIGLPVLASARAGTDGVEAFLATAVLVFAPVMLLYNACAVLLFYLLPGKTSGCLSALRSIASNPLILAAVAGFLVGWLFAPIPAFADRTLELLAAPAAPLALLCIGAAVADALGNLRIGDSLAASLFKIAITPVVAYLLAWAVGLDESALRILMVFAACPSAAASFVFAREMGGDTALASNAVVLSTLLSPVALTVVLALFF